MSPSFSKKYHTAFGKNLRVPTAGTFFRVPIILRVDLDTLLGVLQAYVVAFCIQEVYFEIQFLGFCCSPSGFKIYCLSISCT